MADPGGHSSGDSYVATIVSVGIPFVLLPVAIVVIAVKDGLQALLAKKEVREDPHEAALKRIRFFINNPDYRHPDPPASRSDHH
ncbi:hypothetical protein A3B21_04585 [Candidatus Uhrbacteria bacterium RIFCSPLOWO2_01_FULL_47_24]|uniref:Uncharacterized protein n=1 Tax=Candidatus Uhrbacteria bacterium RIFCSPLOWO2_01_FULL_47_24 TaxID=1802401 RepID=A0A1F7UVK7_9BACT|nr:MAG: hypothetical protein A3D58_00275 [Candidatus Uhrbacteria bacterium RIFCSPHIGHO2_02_FULL_46_47]OGL75017.1 MAG: hypothetical protein A3F52_01390 [Candidatus Uhrbacteria bacterium RIFCSPHIGHO2_12_FULL_47_11]OGL81697.1 MAG: hypothetical protein A3B21_04585 [Candidatus Uhrbacteria bacterium RIFCSPLOWO2_01_FULL_47_24]OGL85050.1 MAG: hypothetical protein A3J03_03735 [Candidatus Uhrbacteria bacterium RIFCSPLOWO2_02_FULL_46_25]OGL93142.1 MAG: hypothetical protein A3H11_00205 [Candidatus Uhrbacte